MGQSGKKTVFIAEDDSDDREFLIDILEKSGYPATFTLFDHGEQLFEHLSGHPKEIPDLILLDLNMPIMDGFETLRELKSDTNLKPIPVMILTSSPRAGDEESCYALGCDYFHKKPITLSGYKNLATQIAGYGRI